MKMPLNPLEAWRCPTEYLVKNDYPDIVAYIRYLALAVHDDACCTCRNADMQESCLRRSRIGRLGKSPDA